MQGVSPLVSAIDANEVGAIASLYTTHDSSRTISYWVPHCPIDTCLYVNIMTYALLKNHIPCAVALHGLGAPLDGWGLFNLVRYGSLECVLLALDVFKIDVNMRMDHGRHSMDGLDPSKKQMVRHLIARGARCSLDMWRWCASLYAAQRRCKEAAFATLCALQRHRGISKDVRRLLVESVLRTRMWAEWEK